MFHIKVIEKIKPHILYLVTFKNRAFYEVMWKNVVQLDKSTHDNIVRRMSIACRITKAANTHS